MPFPAVLMNFPNSKVCLIGEWSIRNTVYQFMNVLCHCVLHELRCPSQKLGIALHSVREFVSLLVCQFHLSFICRFVSLSES